MRTSPKQTRITRLAQHKVHHTVDGQITFGGWLKQQRSRLGITQDSLAVQADCAVGTIRRFEQDAGSPSRHIAELLAVFFAVPADEVRRFVHWARGLGYPPPSILTTIIAHPATRTDTNHSIIHLPKSPTSLVGRDNDVANVVKLLGHKDVRLVTLTGPGGVGKTRLALAVAQIVASYYSKVTFISLDTVVDPTEVQSIIDNALSELLGSHSTKVGASLLVLDNFEHLIAAVDSVGYVLDRYDHVKVLVTSRATLRVYGEHEFPVQPLAIPCDQHTSDLTGLGTVASVQLFMQRVRAVKPDFVLTTTNAEAVAAICRRMEGVPLALELAAARAKALSPQALLVRLTDRLTLLTGGSRNLPTRQQTLRRAVAWSFNLLAPPAQNYFTRLAVFGGTFGEEAAEAVSGATFEDLIALADQSLLQQRDESAGLPRWGMLEYIREFGLEQLKAQGEEESARIRHVAYFLRTAGVAEEPV